MRLLLDAVGKTGTDELLEATGEIKAELLEVTEDTGTNELLEATGETEIDELLTLAEDHIPQLPDADA